MNKTKVCSKCKVEYPATSEYWHRDKRGKYGLVSQCKKCKKKYQKQWQQENKEQIRQYQKQYHRENKEQLKEKRKLYYQENKEQELERERQRYQDNKDYYLEYAKLYYQENKEKRQEQNRQWYQENKEEKLEQAKHWRQENKEQIRQYQKQYQRENPDKARKYKQCRRARKQELPYTLTIQEWLETKKTFDNSCAYCGMTREEHQLEHEQILHQDHFIPLSKGGGYTKENIIPACRSCNTSKKDTDFEEWYPQQEYYSKEREQKILDYMGGLNEI